MEEAANALDSKFQETERKIDMVAWKVDQVANIELEGGESLSAAKLLKNFQDLKKEFTAVSKEVEQLKTEQQTVMAAIIEELNTAMSAADKLEEKLNLPSNEPDP